MLLFPFNASLGRNYIDPVVDEFIYYTEYIPTNTTEIQNEHVCLWYEVKKKHLRKFLQVCSVLSFREIGKIPLFSDFLQLILWLLDFLFRNKC